MIAVFGVLSMLMLTVGRMRSTLGGPSFPYLQYDLLLNALDADYCTFEGGNPPQLSQFDPSNGKSRYCFSAKLQQLIGSSLTED